MTDDLWSAYGDRLRRFILSKVKRDADAEDVLQDVFLKVHAAAGTLADPAKAEAWIFQIARRAVVDHFRRHRPGETPPDLEDKVPPAPLTAQIAACLPSMLETLPQADREALRLTDVEGLPQKDLANRIGVSLPGAKSRVQRARSRLKDILLACCDVEFDRRGNVLSYTPRRCGC